MATEGTTCKRDVKDVNGNTVKCGTFLPKGKPECAKKDSHVWKFKSGFCNSGWHEGTTAQDGSGQYVRTCHLWNKCNCDCHVQMDKMFQMTGEQRILVENPKYKPVKSPFIMPNPLEIAEIRRKEEEDRAQRSIAAKSAGHFKETASGHRQRGQLEYEVLRVCQQFSRGLIEVEVLTPNVIANEIDEIEPPSVGAIGAVFDRWTKLGFANCEKKPVRFTSFTVDGQLHGLDAMKAKAKQDNKRKLAEANRGKLRPRK